MTAAMMERRRYARITVDLKAEVNILSPAVPGLEGETCFGVITDVSVQGARLRVELARQALLDLVRRSGLSEVLVNVALPGLERPIRLLAMVTGCDFETITRMATCHLSIRFSELESNSRHALYRYLDGAEHRFGDDALPGLSSAAGV